MDILGPFVEVDGYQYVLVITDHFSRFVWTHKLQTQSAREIAHHYLKTFQTLAILPSIILTDRGSGFDKALARAIADAWAIDKRATSAYHPQCNGMPERFNQTLAAMLAKLLGNHQEDWPTLLRPLAYAYNSAHHPSIGMAPVTALYGLPPISPLRRHARPRHQRTRLHDPHSRRGFPRRRASRRSGNSSNNSTAAPRSARRRPTTPTHDTATPSTSVGDKVWLWTPHLGRNRKSRATPASSPAAGPAPTPSSKPTPTASTTACATATATS